MKKKPARSKKEQPAKKRAAPKSCIRKAVYAYRPLNGELNSFVTSLRRPMDEESGAAIGTMKVVDKRRRYTYAVHYMLNGFIYVTVLRIEAGCRRWSNFTEAYQHYRKGSFHTPEIRREALARLRFLEAKIHNLNDVFRDYYASQPALTFRKL